MKRAARAPRMEENIPPAAAAATVAVGTRKRTSRQPQRRPCLWELPQAAIMAVRMPPMNPAIAKSVRILRNKGTRSQKACLHATARSLRDQQTRSMIFGPTTGSLATLISVSSEMGVKRDYARRYAGTTGGGTPGREASRVDPRSLSRKGSVFVSSSSNTFPPWSTYSAWQNMKTKPRSRTILVVVLLLR